MCGIYLSVFDACNTSGDEHILSGAKTLIKNRGPDLDGEYRDQKVLMYSSVLAIRKPTTQQPLKGAAGRYVMQWNGELYSPGPLVQFGKDGHSNDGQALLVAIQRWGPLKVLASIVDAEFAITVYDVVDGIIYYARDPLGRRSLMVYDGCGGCGCSCGGVGGSSGNSNINSIKNSNNSTNNSITSIDNENGAFCISSVAPPQAPQSQSTQRSSWCEVDAGGKLFKYVISSKKIEQTQYFDFSKLLFPPPPIKSGPNDLVGRFSDLLRKSIMERIESEIGAPLHRPLSVLFSGGVDSLLITIELLSLIKEQGIPLTVELVNISFKGGESPDRLRGLEAFSFLQAEFGDTATTFKAVDVGTDEYMAARERIIDLSFPKKTVMDISIAAPIYFASKASTSRVNLLGMGADEQLAGYSAHRKAFSCAGLAGVEQECRRQLMHIHTRNLGRDDRIVGDQGKEARFPFLSLPLVSFLSSCPVEHKYNDGGGGGRMDKIILRSRLLQFKSFLPERFALMPKQAIQFGARSSNIEGSGGSGGSVEIVK